MNDNDAQMIARGARDRYMRADNARDRDDDALPGPVSEGAYTYPMPIGERGMERGRHYVSANAPRSDSRPPSEMRRDYRDGARPMRTPAVYDERYVTPSHWRRESEGGGWEEAAFDDWGSQRGPGPSAGDGRQQWSHPIPRDPRSDYFTAQSDDRRAASLAPFGERRDGQNATQRDEPPAWRGRDRGRR